MSNRLDAYLTARGLRVKEFAEHAGVSPAIVSSARQGAPVVDARVAQKISIATDGAVAIDDLAGSRDTAFALWCDAREHQRDLDLEAMAVETGVGIQTLRRMRGGMLLVNLDVAAVLARRTGLRIEDLIVQPGERVLSQRENHVSPPPSSVE